ncbi:3-oxo-tetronate kinase [Actinosynnema mirum]|uniref:3-oxo-tetronate kinase n=1 Tax=Actinosynnema mirum (strain ATCC 29888 / DSM 43827 / JCM 3225 / NBRC 14064 / NCIMB 13271 / NRRL B-12336 / IMRU 3971 / 101) TaxID=446462 RepID=C6WCZ4_ACTMD|nr:3-oxo-tetronate kinase [Actinosynnema mirum]ACU37613.1 type III effector Hrp-dependent outers [Actinosynnema mirum DSM 43827]
MLGAIADDFTGATDLAIMLRRNGHRVAVAIEDHDPGERVRAGLDALVIALKSRTAPVAEAVAATRAAHERLLDWGARRVYVKYCSTFDSTDEGNIGPVLDAVADRAGAERVVVVPSLPANGRTVHEGLLHVNGQLLEHSPLRHHPLTPMTRSRVADLLRPQTRHEVAELHLDVVRSGRDALRAALDATAARYVVVDAVDDADLAVIGAAVAGDAVVSGGSGLALGLPDPHGDTDGWTAPASGRRAVLCGSASTATRRQVADAAGRAQPVLRVDPVAAVRTPDLEVDRIAAWAVQQPADSTPVIHTTADAADLVPEVDGLPAAPAVETVLAGVARRLVVSGVRHLLVAGGETSGAVVRALGVGVLRVGPEIAPGICWAAAAAATGGDGDDGGHEVALALKSGNFGPDDLFTSAWDRLA